MIWLVAGFVSLGVLCSPAGKSHIIFAPFDSWNDAVWLRNDRLEVAIVPEIGRIMCLRRPGDTNLLWNNPELKSRVERTEEWANYGGDKLWPAPQQPWGWPPDVSFEGSPHRWERRGDAIRMISPEGKRDRVRFVRDIRLRGDRLEIRNTMTNTADTTRKLSVWQITQVDYPDAVLMRLDRPVGPPWVYRYDNRPLNPLFHLISGDRMVIRRDPHNAIKFGARSKTGLLVARKGRSYLEMFAADVPGATYPDEDSAQQVYTSADPYKYVELELAGPLVDLAPGQSTSFEVTLRLQGS